MTALVGAELLKLRTTRAWIGYALALVAVTAIGVSATIGSAASAELSDPEFQRDLVSNAAWAGLMAFLLGITSVTWEWRHGTSTPTFLATPRRERVVVAKVVAACLVGVVLAIAALVIVAAIAGIWLSAEGTSLSLDGGMGSRVGRVTLAAVIWGALGAATGSFVHSQVGALVGSLIWLILLEGLLTALLGLVDLDRVGDFFPGAALTSLEGSEGGDDGLGPWAGALVGIVYVAVIGALGVVRTRHRDVT